MVVHSRCSSSALVLYEAQQSAIKCVVVVVVAVALVADGMVVLVLFSVLFVESKEKALPSEWPLSGPDRGAALFLSSSHAVCLLLLPISLVRIRRAPGKSMRAIVVYLHHPSGIQLIR